MMNADIIIVGSGITGTALARELSRYHVSVLVLDRGADVADGATKANSGIVHAGYDAIPGTQKALFNVRGAAMFPELCRQLSVPFRRCGAYVIGFDDADRKTIESLLSRGLSNGVQGLQILSGAEVLQKEPSLNSNVQCALSIPSSAIVSPYELAYALADDAALNGVSFLFDKEITDIFRDNDQAWHLVSADGSEYTCRVIVNCSGSSGADLHNRISGLSLKMIHRRGQYYLLDRMESLPFSSTIFQCPSPMGKGVLVSPTIHGNLLIGPNAEDINDPLDTATTYSGLAQVLEKARKTWPLLSLSSNITNFSGVRAHLDSDDFLIGPVSGAANAYEAIGIESPGLSSAPAVASALARLISDDMSLSKKSDIVPFPKIPKPFFEMNDEERANAVQSDPEYGRIVCRCEVVTEAEVRYAIRRPVGARTLDGIKRRTRAGMGRCQAGFCSPGVAQILSEETGIPMLEITKSGGNSRILSGTIEDFLKGSVKP